MEKKHNQIAHTRIVSRSRKVKECLKIAIRHRHVALRGSRRACTPEVGPRRPMRSADEVGRCFGEPQLVKLDRILVFRLRRPERTWAKLSSELGLAISPASHVRVGGH